MKISIIAALTSDHIIGYNGKIPWHSKVDMVRFSRRTMGKPCIMGRKTWESLPGPLEGRRNIVLSDSHGTHEYVADLDVFEGWNEALLSCRYDEEVMIIGGSQVYSTFIDVADKMYLTWVLGTYDGDTYFPQFKFWEWKLVDQELHTQVGSQPKLIFETWERNR